MAGERRLGTGPQLLPRRHAAWRSLSVTGACTRSSRFPLRLSWLEQPVVLIKSRPRIPRPRMRWGVPGGSALHTERAGVSRRSTCAEAPDARGTSCLFRKHPLSPGGGLRNYSRSDGGRKAARREKRVPGGGCAGPSPPTSPPTRPGGLGSRITGASRGPPLSARLVHPRHRAPFPLPAAGPPPPLL